MQPVREKRSISFIESLENKKHKSTNDGKTSKIFSEAINESEVLENNHLKDSSKLDVPHPEIIKILKKGIQCAIKTTDWIASKGAALMRVSRINQKAKIIFQFHPPTGEILYLEEISKCTNSMIPVVFEFFSKNEVRLDREDLKECLRPSSSNDIAQEKGISITALKILLTFEKLFSRAIDFSEEEITSGEIIYLGALNIVELQAVIEDSTNQKILECWTWIQQNTKEASFLNGHLYAENPHDQKWDSKWSKEEISENDVLIVKKMKENGIERFANAKKIKPSKPYKGCIRIFCGKDFKNLGPTHLKDHITRIW